MRRLPPTQTVRLRDPAWRQEGWDLQGKIVRRKDGRLYQILSFEPGTDTDVLVLQPDPPPPDDGVIVDVRW
jgi:hypothetical protein